MKEVYLSERERGVLVLFAERFEGTRSQIRMMDAALDVVDPGFAMADKMQQTEQGVILDVTTMNEAETKLEFEDAPFEALYNFLSGQTIPYSRRPNAVGRVLIGVMEKLDKVGGE